MSNLFGPEQVPLDERGTIEIDLPPFGWQWLRVVRPGDRRIG
jgi:hypothetical protein